MPKSFSRLPSASASLQQPLDQDIEAGDGCLDEGTGRLQQVVERDPHRHCGARAARHARQLSEDLVLVRIWC
jgi:hypothetical protein